MRAADSFLYSSPIAADSGTFQLVGGAYVIDVVGNLNSGSVTLQRLGPDGATFITATTAISAQGTSGAVVLPPGTYKLSVSSASALYVSVVRVPGE